MSEVFHSMKQGLKEAIEFAGCKDNCAKVLEPRDIDVKKSRQRVGVTQVEFASMFGISLGTLRRWERGDRIPCGTALVLLNLVSKDPQISCQINSSEQK